MVAAFEKFCQDCNEALSTFNGPEGRQIVQKNLENLLSDPEFVAAECGPDAKPGIRTMYRDAETGFNVLVHVYEEGKKARHTTTGAAGPYTVRQLSGQI